MNHIYEYALREAIDISIAVRWTQAVKVGYAAMDRTYCPLCVLARQVRRESRISPGKIKIDTCFFCPLADGAAKCCKEYEAFLHAFSFHKLKDQQQCAREMILRLQAINVSVWSRQLFEKILSLQGVWYPDVSAGGDDVS